MTIVKQAYASISSQVAAPSQVRGGVRGIHAGHLSELQPDKRAAAEHPPKGVVFTTLTKQEDAILNFMIDEMASNRDIAKHFGISEETVKRHLSNIFDKTGASSRLELVVMTFAKRQQQAETNIESHEVVIGLRFEIAALQGQLSIAEAKAQKELLENQRIISSLETQLTFANKCVEALKAVAEK